MVSKTGKMNCRIDAITGETKCNNYPTNVNDIISSDEFKLYPNPASDFIEISGLNPRFKSWVNDVDIKIYNTLGESVLTPLAFGEGPGVRLDISALSPGLYFLCINNGKEMLTGSFIVMK
jgi:hypothetical protein